MSISNCCFLTCIQISQEAGYVVWNSHLFQNFPQFIVIHIVKGFGVVNKAEIDVFLEFSCLFYDPMDIGNLISGSFPVLNPAWISASSWFTYCWTLAWRILSITLLAREMDRGAWWAAVHGSRRVGHDWATSLSLFTFMHWRRKWQSTPVFLRGESQGGSLVGCCVWGNTELDTTEGLHFHFSLSCIGEGNGTPLQCSCLENPRDGGAWWAAIRGVAQGRPRLKGLGSSSSSVPMSVLLS